MNITEKTFTDAQLECIQQIANGFLQKRMPDTMERTQKAIERHMANARKRIGAKNTVHLVAQCLRAGVIK
jgi:DNA-binding CsgD family transcriptional regulator